MHGQDAGKRLDKYAKISLIVQRDFGEDRCTLTATLAIGGARVGWRSPTHVELELADGRAESLW